MSSLHMPPTPCTPTSLVASKFPILPWVTSLSLQYPLFAGGFANSFLACCVNELLSFFNHSPTSSFPSLTLSLASYPLILTSHTLSCLVLESQLGLPGSVHKVLHLKISKPHLAPVRLCIVHRPSNMHGSCTTSHGPHFCWF